MAELKLSHLGLVLMVVTSLTILTQLGGGGGTGGGGHDFTAPPGRKPKHHEELKQLAEKLMEEPVDKYQDKPARKVKAGDVVDLLQREEKLAQAQHALKLKAEELKRKQDQLENHQPDQQKQKKEEPDQVEPEALLVPFIEDNTFDTRCKATIPPLGTCPDRREMEHTNQPKYTLKRGITSGPTTKGMTVITVEGGKQHHPIFDAYAERTFTYSWLKGRVAEFVGVHTDYDYDCENHVAAGDFRSYHQVRGAMCNEHEASEKRFKKDANAKFTGMYPLVDEEYYEYIMTLTTAYDAAQAGKPYTFIELGARYGTWIVRAGGAYSTWLDLNPANKKVAGTNEDLLESKQVTGNLKLLAVEGNCEWFQKMHEHVNCNGFQSNTDLILAYAAPRSYNEFKLEDKRTHSKGRAVSLLDILPHYDVVDMMDLDIQGFEWLTLNEPGVFDLLTEKVAFVHFGTHSTEIEKNILRMFQKPNSGWCVVYVFNGAHTKKLNRGTKCNTPYGPSLFNDGVLGVANSKFYPQVAGADKCPKTPAWSGSKGSKICYSHPLMDKEFLRDGRPMEPRENMGENEKPAEGEQKAEAGKDEDPNDAKQKDEEAKDAKPADEEDGKAAKPADEKAVEDKDAKPEQPEKEQDNEKEKELEQKEVEAKQAKAEAAELKENEAEK